jgi:transcriptional regulator with XRE-family HTH domain
VALVDWTSLPQILKDVRKAAGLTMKDLAVKLGVSVGAVDHYEGGRRTPDPETVDAFVSACGKKLVFEIVEPGVEVVPLDASEQELVSLWRAATPERREALMQFGYLLPSARPGAGDAALGVLRTLQERAGGAVESDRWAVGDPRE